uniref:Uncharacterized protein n=1 Tax=Arundo donax TaxID=35708 RepID=A0A0A9BUI2_ARUDO
MGIQKNRKMKIFYEILSFHRCIWSETVQYSMRGMQWDGW